MSYRLGFGPPFEPEHRVRVVAAIDRTVHDVSRFIGQTGTARRLVIDGHCGETLEDPLMVVALDDGAEESFWREELEAA